MYVPISKYIRANTILHLFRVDIRHVLLYRIAEYGIFVISVNKIHRKLWGGDVHHQLICIIISTVQENVSMKIMECNISYTLNQKSKSPPPSIFSYISKSILPILMIQTVMDMEASYAKTEWYVSANWWHCWCEIMHFMTKGVKKSCTIVIFVSFYTNNKRITHVSELSSTIYCMSLYVLLLISITMNEVFNNRSTICFDHLATPLQHARDQSLYATLIQVGPGPLQNALEFL